MKHIIKKMPKALLAGINEWGVNLSYIRTSKVPPSTRTPKNIGRPRPLGRGVLLFPVHRLFGGFSRWVSKLRYSFYIVSIESLFNFVRGKSKKKTVMQKKKKKSPTLLLNFLVYSSFRFKPFISSFSVHLSSYWQVFRQLGKPGILYLLDETCFL